MCSFSRSSGLDRMCAICSSVDADSSSSGGSAVTSCQSILLICAVEDGH